MTPTKKPPFRADHVGSLLRPPRLIQARTQYLEGNLDPEALRSIEDETIREVVALQEEVGLQPITDGEHRRTNFRDVFFDATDGYSSERKSTGLWFRGPDGKTREAGPAPSAIGRLNRRESINGPSVAFLRSLTNRTVKTCLPSPSIMHFFLGPRVNEEGAYPDIRSYMADVSKLYREELAELANLGCTYVQFDEVPLAILCDPAMQQSMTERGDNFDDLVDLYIDAINDAVRERPADMAIAIHMCRGNEGAGMASGGYEPVAERLFNNANVDGFLLEFDTPRAGDFSPLRCVPKGKMVCLGIVSTKLKEIETANELKARIEEASKYIDPDQLGICPQCGFATRFVQDRLTIDDERRKLANMVTVAEQIWG